MGERPPIQWLSETEHVQISDLGVPAPQGAIRFRWMPGDVGDEVEQLVDLASIGGKSPLDRLLRTRMTTRPIQSTGMEERHTPKSELLRTRPRVDISTPSTIYLSYPDNPCIAPGQQLETESNRGESLIAYSVNVSYLMPDLPTEERLRRVRDAGFEYFEWLFPQRIDVDELVRLKDEYGLTMVLLDTEVDAENPRGQLSNPYAGDAFFARLDEAVEIARFTGARLINALCGLIPAGRGARAASRHADIEAQKGLCCGRSRRHDNLDRGPQSF